MKLFEINIKNPNEINIQKKDIKTLIIFIIILFQNNKVVCP